MIITNEEILKYEQNRVKFNKYYNDAVLDVLVLKHAGNTIKEIQNLTPYDINFIVHVIQQYSMHSNIDDDDSYLVSVKINKYNVNVQDMKQMGYNEALIKEAIHSSEIGPVPSPTFLACLVVSFKMKINQAN